MDLCMYTQKMKSTGLPALNKNAKFPALDVYSLFRMFRSSLENSMLRLPFFINDNKHSIFWPIYLYPVVNHV